MASDLVAAAERYRRNNPSPPPGRVERIENHLVLVHVTHPRQEEHPT